MNRAFAFLTLFLTFGCTSSLPASTAAVPMAQTPPIAVTTTTIVFDAASIMTLWRHTLAKSRFNTGAVTSIVRDDLHHSKLTTGDQGNYIEGDTGLAEALPAATARVLSAPPLADPVAHRALALAYFQASGLTFDQTDLAQVYETTTMSGSGAPGAAQTLVHMYTNVPRMLDKTIRVDDSMAYVGFDAAGEVVSETVYWPAVSDTAVATARQLVTLHADPVRYAAYLAKVVIALEAHNIPASLAEAAAAHGQILLHHTPFTSTDITVTSSASFDVGVHGTTLHFSVDGVEQTPAKATAQAPR
jgi:hypothetical protein